jgi:hypothetical protein
MHLFCVDTLMGLANVCSCLSIFLPKKMKNVFLLSRSLEIALAPLKSPPPAPVIPDLTSITGFVFADPDFPIMGSDRRYSYVWFLLFNIILKMHSCLCVSMYERGGVYI